ncbi:ABC transporter permease, partial [bacterium]|nr:ABC transporter permease [candidate division CSSED10-310 bacterium]
LRTVGANPQAAEYAGMSVAGSYGLAMTLSGALAGLAGASEVMGLNHTLPAAFSTGYGFDSIAVALLARSHPLAVIPAAVLWGALRNGAGLMQLRSGISIDLVNIMQAVVIIFVAAEAVLRRLLRMGGDDSGPRFSVGWGS